MKTEQTENTILLKQTPKKQQPPKPQLPNSN